MKHLDLTGQRFGKLVAVAFERRNGYSAWRCVCDCGNEAVVLTSNLRGGNSKACVCSKKLVRKTHGRYRHKAYTAWRCMRRRCLSPKASDYPNYGGRGISIDPRWDDIELFIEDMGSPPRGRATLERLEVNGPYTKDNCVWASRATQANNKRNSIKIEGEPLTEWCKKHGMSYEVGRARHHKGWPPEAIKNTPVVARHAPGQRCSVAGCGSPVKSKGFCNRHYLRHWKGLPLEPQENLRK